ncbi:UbiA family prenyltransferase [Nocardioides sp.]|uniref:UbiA family prenyltransferase n=1 Tax=Nocardioides sp. TaxID=35761 RepID=UPI00286E9B16|nr:UbiA family prenyltransferase [Nocardioides sp.]
MSPLKRQRERAPADAIPRTPHAAPAPVPTPPPARSADDTAESGRHRFRLSETLPALLARAAHPKQALLTALGLAVAAAISGRPLRESALVFTTVLVGQALLGWDNDLVDRARDERHERPGKPIASGLLDLGTAWFSVTCALLLVVPLSLNAGSRAGAAYLIALLIGVVGNRVLRGSVLSFVPWMLQFGLYPAYLAYGGWNGTGPDTPPTVVMTVLAGLLGLGVHFLRALPGLVPDNADGLRSLPLRIALRTGAPRLLVLSGVFTGAVVVVLLIAGQAIGLT